MCGICGKVAFAGGDVEPDALRRMCSALVHRGPDAEGIRITGAAGLAQRRLSIIDLTPAAVAPLSNEDGTIWVTLNGEIYNFRELRAELSARGHTFRTASDTEVIVHLYEELGVDCLARLTGMFAFAIWDARQQRLFAARDRLGKKPLFYAKTPGTLVFASSIGAILAEGTVAAVPFYTALDEYLTYQYVPSPETAFAGISKVPPAHYLTCGADGSMDVRRYWQPPLWTANGQAAGDTRELEAELLERLTAAVRARMVADVPLGAFLSGGVDSSAVVAIMAGASSRPVKTFSIGFEETAFNELPYARQIARRYGTDHHEFVVRANAAEVLPDLVRHYGEPFADSSALPTYYLSKLTREHVTVALSGDGGDENFGGYENYALVSAWRRADAVPRAARNGVRRVLDAVLEPLGDGATAGRLRRAAAMLAAGTAERFRLQSSIFKPEEKHAAYTRRFRALLADASPAECRPASIPLKAGDDPLAWMMWHDLQFYLPDCLMVKVDVASMASSLEVRAPLLDHRLVEFAATIPPSLKRNATGGKAILKRALAALVPQESLSRPKQGFGVPLRGWFRGELLDLVRGSLLDERALRRGLFEQAFLTRIVDDQVAGRRDWSHRLWALVWLELWFREFID